MRVALKILAILAATAKGLSAPVPVDQVARWKAAQISPRSTIALDVAVKLFERNKARYQVIQAMRANGVPAEILFCLHYRESDNNFRCSLAQGDPLTHRSRNVPRGRLPDKEPPYTFEECAADAVYNVDRLDKIKWNDLQSALQGIESYNGLGVQKFHPGFVSGYILSGTNLYHGGKYSSDGKWNAKAWDAQLGVVAILKRMQMRGIALPFK